MNGMNVIWILADQMRKDCIGAYGNPFVCTPNLDRLCSRAIRFDRMYVANPICAPSRTTLFSGLSPSNHGVYTNGLVKEDDGRNLLHELKKYGYQTANIGKIHFNPYSRESYGRSLESEAAWKEVPRADAYTDGYFGFDYVEFTIGHTLPCAHYYKWFLDSGGTEDMFEVLRYRPEWGQDEVCGVRKMPARLSSSAFVGERSVHYLREVRDRAKPFFLSVSFPDPHHPFTSCQEDFERWDGREVKRPAGGPQDLQTRPLHYRQQYEGRWSRQKITPPQHENGIPEEIALERIRHTYAMVQAIDRNIGLLLEEMDRQDLWENTILLFTADHGELLGDHGLWKKGPFFYEGLINTPLILYDPRLRAGENKKLFSGLDIAPTMLEMLGIPVPAYMDGVPQYGAMQSKQAAARGACPIEYRNGYSQDVFCSAVVGGDYKYVFYETGEEEYTDLGADPGEAVNRAKDPAYAPRVAAARRELLRQKSVNKPKGTPQFGLA